MTRALFGTDGIRGRANRHPMTPDVCLALGRAVAANVRNLGETSRVVIGRDTRRSGPMLEAALAAGCNAAGVDVVLAGVLPTPGVAYLTQTLAAGAGLVISASHNPAHDNGVKVFGRDGFKLSDAQEAELETLCQRDDLTGEVAVPAMQVGCRWSAGDGAAQYAAALKAQFPHDLSLKGVRLLVDCAHGACHEIGPRVFEELGADIVAIGVKPNGDNINDGVGATATERAAAAVAAGDADLGVAFDGDGDRVIFIDESGTRVDGDELLTIGALAMQAQGTLRGGAIVATVMSNVGLDAALEDQSLKVIRSAVGDRYVVEAMRQHGANFGGEQSGHLVCLDHGTTGDGIASALLILAERQRQGRPLAELRAQMTRYPQALINVAVREKPPLDQLPRVARLIIEAEAALGRRGRVLLRYSGTEPKARVMVEGDDPATVADWAARIAEAVKTDIGGTS